MVKNMNVKKITMIFVPAVILAILGYDVFAYMNGGQQSTVSNVVIEWSHQYPAMTFFIGFVMGHLFWQMRKLDT